MAALRGVGASVGPSLGRLLASCQQTGFHLSNLNLRGCPELLSISGLNAIFEGLGDAQLPGLRTLDLNGCDIRPAAAPALGALLKRCTNLQELRLGSNPALLTREGMAALHRGLGPRGMPSLANLHLGDCDIQAPEAESLGKLLGRVNERLETLTLSRNRCLTTSVGLAGIERGLAGKGMPALRELLVYRNFTTNAMDIEQNLRRRLGVGANCFVYA